jgi:hypothetical protein
MSGDWRDPTPLHIADLVDLARSKLIGRERYP